MIPPTSTAPPASEPSSRRRRTRITLFASVLGIVVGLLAGECVIRLALFRPGSWPDGISVLAESIRRPERYANGNSEDDYWKLVSRSRASTARLDALNPDPILGWIDADIVPGTYAHIDERSLRGRRPVLLYGDSFAQGRTPHDQRFQAIFERSEFSEQYAMLNYGVGGYGLDQIYLLLEHSIDRFKDLDPIVIVGILVESDLDRSILAFRGWPKPRLVLAGDRLLPPGTVQTNTREYLEQNPISIRSYLWSLFLHARFDFLDSQRARWRGDARIEEEKKRLNRRILIEIERALASRGLRHFFLVFHAEFGALRTSGPFEWQEKLIQDVCAEFSIPLVDTRAFLSFASDASQAKCAEFYGQDGTMFAHHTAIGNLICLEAMAQGLRGNFVQPDMGPLAALRGRGLLDPSGPETTSMTLLGRVATVITHGSGGALRATESSNPARLLLYSDALGPTVAQFDLRGAAKRLTGQLHTILDADQGCGELEIRFSLVLDDEVALEEPVPPAAHPLQLDVDLLGKRSLKLIVEGRRGAPKCNWICIEDPSLE